MTFWLIISGLSLCAVAFVMWPFLRKRDAHIDGTRQTLLAALEKAEKEDKDEAMRTELARRLIAHDREHRAAQKTHNGALGWALGVVAVLAIPFGALAIYAFHGAYALIEIQRDDAEVLQAVVKVEERLKTAPEDWRGWSVVAPVYRSRGQFDKADEAFANAVKFAPNLPADQKAEWVANRVELLSMKNEGNLPVEARPLLDEALAANRNNPKAMYFDAIYAEQHQAAAIASQKWTRFADYARGAGAQGLLAEAERRITRLAMVDDDRSIAPDQNVAIAGMVAGLAERLQSEGGLPAEWLRLVRAYHVLGEAEQLAEARANARNAFKGDAVSLQALEQLEKDLGL